MAKLELGWRDCTATLLDIKMDVEKKDTLIKELHSTLDTVAEENTALLGKIEFAEKELENKRLPIAGNLTHIVTSIDYLNAQIHMLHSRAEAMDQADGNSLELRQTCVELSTGVDILSAYLKAYSKVKAQ